MNRFKKSTREAIVRYLFINGYLSRVIVLNKKQIKAEKKMQEPEILSIDDILKEEKNMTELEREAMKDLLNQREF